MLKLRQNVCDVLLLGIILVGGISLTGCGEPAADTPPVLSPDEEQEILQAVEDAAGGEAEASHRSD